MMMMMISSSSSSGSGSGSRSASTSTSTSTSTIYIIIIELPRCKTILENSVEIEPQPVALDFKNLSQYSSRSK